MKSNYKRLGDYIRPVDVRNKDLISTELLGINIDKFFMPSVANIIGTDLRNYKLLNKGQFACNPMHVGRDEKLPIALYLSDTPAIVSPAYFVFEVIDSNLLCEYLMLWFRRLEFDRECWFYTDASVRGGISWEAICDMQLPIPEIAEQRRIVNAYNTIERRIELKRKINENLEGQAKTLYNETFVNSSSTNWRQGTLKDLLKVKYGKDHKHLSDGNIPLYGSGGIMRFVEKYLYDKVSILIPRKGTLNNVVYVDEPFWSVDTMFYTEILKSYVAKFVFYYIKSKNLAGMDTGSAVPSMSSEIIYSMQLRIPDENTLILFDNYIEPLFKQMKVNNKESVMLKRAQDILLTTLFSH